VGEVQKEERRHQGTYLVRCGNTDSDLLSYNNCINSRFQSNERCTYLLVTIVKNNMKLERSTYEVLQILSISLTDKTHLKDLFDKTKLQYDKDRFGPNGPNLFNVQPVPNFYGTLMKTNIMENFTFKELLRNVRVFDTEEDELLLNTSKLDDAQITILLKEMVENRGLSDYFLNKSLSNKEEVENLIAESEDEDSYAFFQPLVEFAYFTSQGYDYPWPECYVDLTSYKFYFPDIHLIHFEELDIDTL